MMMQVMMQTIMLVQAMLQVTSDGGVHDTYPHFKIKDKTII
jgi:hypothetical protein